MTEERKLSSRNLALILCHDILLSKGGIQAGDGPLKQAILRHKTRLNSEFIRIKIRRGAKSNEELAQVGDARAGEYCPLRYTHKKLPQPSTNPSLRSHQHDHVDDRRCHQTLRVQRFHSFRTLRVKVMHLALALRRSSFSPAKDSQSTNTFQTSSIFLLKRSSKMICRTRPAKSFCRTKHHVSLHWSWLLQR